MDTVRDAPHMLLCSKKQHTVARIWYFEESPEFRGYLWPSGQFKRREARERQRTFLYQFFPHQVTPVTRLACSRAEIRRRSRLRRPRLKGG